MLKKIFGFALKHKVVSIIIILVVTYVGYSVYKKYTSTVAEIRYVVTTIDKGAVVASVSGSGQVSATSQVDIKAKTTGDIIYLGAKVGQEVKTGTILVSLDSRDAQKAVRDAESSLESTRLSFEKLVKPADQLSILQSQNSLAQAVESKQNAQNDLIKSYDDGFNTVSNVFLDLPGIITGLRDMLFNSDFGVSQQNLDYYADSVKDYDNNAFKYRDSAYNAYHKARALYDKNFEDYKAITRYADNGTVETIISQTYDTTKEIAEAVKSANNLIQFYKDKTVEHGSRTSPLADTHLASLNTYTGKTNLQLSNLLSIKKTIQSDKDSIINSQRTIDEKTASLANLKSGADVLDIKSQELSIKQKENALADAKEKFGDYFIRAPFDGVIAKMDLKRGDSLTSGAAVATLISKQRTANISLNEVDVAKIKIGQKTTFTFDAVQGLSITGVVAEIDSIGTVSQGVVSYTVKIIFDTQDERIKPGMSVSASIIIDVKQDVIIAPNGAVKMQGNAYYVEMFDTPLVPVAEDMLGQEGIPSLILPKRQVVEVGLTNDTDTEILSGLKVGDQIIERTITAVSAKPATAAPSLFGGGANRATGSGATGGNAFRALR